MRIDEHPSCSIEAPRPEEPTRWLAVRTDEGVAQTALRDRWSSNDPDTPWTTKTAVSLQLDEIEGAEAIDRDRLAELRKFYRQRISEAN